MESSVAPSVSAKLKKPIAFDLKKPLNVLLLAWVIFAAALGLRAVGIGEYPARHATDDEFHYLWAGLNFWNNGEPASWSGLSGSAALRIGEVQFDSNGYSIVSPALDHPPLFTLMTGAFASLLNPVRLDTLSDTGRTVTVWDINLGYARCMMLLIFSGTFWFLFSLIRSIYPPGVALLTVLFYGFMSHAVTHGRLVIADNMSALLLVANAWAVQRWMAGKVSHGRMAVATVALCAAAVLTKIPAWCHVPAIMTFLVVARRATQIRYVLYGFGAGTLLYLAWVSWFGLPEFLSVMKSQTGRFRGFNAFQLMSGVPRLLSVRDLNGIVIAGWFCLVAQALRPGALPVTTIGPAYALAFTFFAGDVLFGWYGAPLFPWLALALGLTTAQVYARPVSAPMVAWLLLFLPHAFQTLYIAHYELETVLRYAFVIVVAALILAMTQHPTRAQSTMRIALIAIIAVVLMRETYEVTNQRTDRLTDQDKYLR